MKNSIRDLGAYFSSHRMLADYAEKGYLPAHHIGSKLINNDFAGAKELGRWRARVKKAWPEVSILTNELNLAKEIKNGEVFPIVARVNLGSLAPEDVSIEIYYGILDSHEGITKPKTIPMAAEKTKDGYCIYKAEVPCSLSGRYGFSIRATPRHPYLIQRFQPPLLLTWEE